MLEVDLAASVVEHFQALGAVFPEVSCWTAGDRADLVVVRSDASLDLCECKVRPCAKLLRQIQCWAGHAERRWVAYEPPRRDGRSVVLYACMQQSEVQAKK